MTYFHVLILAIVEGITEFLPISSTGHLILTGKLLGLASGEFLKTFDIAIQSGAILAVVVLYWRLLLVRRDVLIRVVAAFIPTGILGLVFYKMVKEWLGSPMVVVWSLAIGGLVLILFERAHQEQSGALDDAGKMSIKTAVAIGFFQALALVPGISRAAATICGGRYLGLSRRAIVEFSFLLALPTMAAATGLDLMKHTGEFSSSQFGQLIFGCAISFVVALLAIRFLLKYIQRHDFKAFGYYRILIAVAFWLLVL